MESEHMVRNDSTMERINRLAEERAQLYRKAGPMSEDDVRRLHQLNRELESLWDQLRRERAARRWGAYRRRQRELFDRVA
jgi:hypothetical protein